MINSDNYYKALLNNVSSTVSEGILKLGFTKGESFGIYYEQDLIHYLLGKDYESPEETEKELHNFMAYGKENHIPLSISHEGRRFRFLVSSEGVSYINDCCSSSGFLKDLISLVSTHAFDLEKVLAVFTDSGREYTVKEVDNAEFEYVISFIDKDFDPYFYCFHFEHGHGHYHRLLEYSYKKLFENA